ncbi:alkyl sulfatase dimerization domain-containing protein [Streptomyces sp. NPDC051642]|uniref:alkyl sulfatase dimerization domain-containing protein n=1 Tax=Streptomyces sp. NPDC051642 TaxID=3154646 RepID=UPI00343AD80E
MDTTWAPNTDPTTYRGHYGSISHDVKGIYQRHTGWFDAKARPKHRNSSVAAISVSPPLSSTKPLRIRRTRREVINRRAVDAT